MLINILSGMAQVETLHFGTRIASLRVTLTRSIVCIILKTTKDVFARHSRTKQSKPRRFAHMSLIPLLNLIPIPMTILMTVKILKLIPIKNSLLNQQIQILNLSLIMYLSMIEM